MTREAPPSSDGLLSTQTEREQDATQPPPEDENASAPGALEDGGTAAVSPPLPVRARRRRPNGTFLDGPGLEASRAALRRANSLAKQRAEVTRALLACVDPGLIAAHCHRMSTIILEGKASDATAAFKALYSLLAVPAAQTVKAAPPRSTASDSEVIPTVIVMPPAPER